MYLTCIMLLFWFTLLPYLFSKHEFWNFLKHFETGNSDRLGLFAKMLMPVLQRCICFTCLSLPSIPNVYGIYFLYESINRLVQTLANIIYNKSRNRYLLNNTIYIKRTLTGKKFVSSETPILLCFIFYFLYFKYIYIHEKTRMARISAVYPWVFRTNALVHRTLGGNDFLGVFCGMTEK